MVARAPRPARLSKEEWVELETRTGLRYDYINGLVFAVTGESRLHNDIVMNVVESLRPRARAKGYPLHAQAVRTRVEKYNTFYYPDVVISAANEPHGSEIHNACFILEVLSPTTADKDRREKLEAYFKIPTLKTYVLVSQEEKRVEIYQKTQWNLLWSELVNAGALEVACLGETLSLEQIYAGLSIPDVTAEPEL